MTAAALRFQNPMRHRTLFENCLLASALAHGLLWLWAAWTPSRSSTREVMEIDLTRPFGGGPAKLAAPKQQVRTSGPKGAAQLSSPLATAKPIQPPVAPPPKEIPIAGQKSQPLQAPAGTQDGTQTKPPEGGSPDGENVSPSAGGVQGGTGVSPHEGGEGRGAAEGSPDGTGFGGGEVAQKPKLLNLDEILRNIRRFYPEAERRAGKESDVTLVLHISAAGAVTSSDVSLSGGRSFDEAAQKVAQLMRFSPAVAKSGSPVAVKIKLPINFRLED